MQCKFSMTYLLFASVMGGIFGAASGALSGCIGAFVLNAASNSNYDVLDVVKKTTVGVAILTSLKKSYLNVCSQYETNKNSSTQATLAQSSTQAILAELCTRPVAIVITHACHEKINELKQKNTENPFRKRLTNIAWHVASAMVGAVIGRFILQHHADDIFSLDGMIADAKEAAVGAAIVQGAWQCLTLAIYCVQRCIGYRAKRLSSQARNPSSQLVALSDPLLKEILIEEAKKIGKSVRDEVKLTGQKARDALNRRINTTTRNAARSITPMLYVNHLVSLFRSTASAAPDPIELEPPSPRTQLRMPD